MYTFSKYCECIVSLLILYNINNNNNNINISILYNINTCNSCCTGPSFNAIANSSDALSCVEAAPENTRPACDGFFTHGPSVDKNMSLVFHGDAATAGDTW